MANDTGNFFDDDVNEVPLQRHLDQQDDHQSTVHDGASPAGNLNSTEPQRRRRPRQPAVILPSFDDELKEGTQLHNHQALSPTTNGYVKDPDVTERTSSNVSKRELSQKTSFRETEPRKIGSQFLDLNRGLVLNASSINEDIVALSKDDLREAIRATEVRRPQTDMRAEQADRIYVERKGKFYALSKRPEEWIETPVPNPLEAPVSLTTDAESRPTLTVYKAFRHLFLFAHGLLAGLAIFHCISIFYASPTRQPDWLFFVRLYAPVTVIFKTLYQALVALCCVSCLCRIDLAGGVDMQLLTRHAEALVSAMLYFAAAALTHLCDVTTMLLLHDVGSTATGGVPLLSQSLLDELVRWRIMDAVRTGCVGVAWVLVAWRWKRDRLQDHLQTRYETRK